MNDNDNNCWHGNSYDCGLYFVVKCIANVVH